VCHGENYAQQIHPAKKETERRNDLSYTAIETICRMIYAESGVEEENGV
jgi:hypothetical protein